MTIREAALRRALIYVGTTENPPGSNKGHMINLWNQDAGAPIGSYWCCSFTNGMYRGVGYLLGGGASVGALLSWARPRGYVVKRPRRGDLVCFEFGEGAWADDDHIGQIIRVLALRWKDGQFAGWIRTVEGNTSAQADLTGSQSNGGGVFIRTRWIRKPIGAKFVRVPGNVA